MSCKRLVASIAAALLAFAGPALAVEGTPAHDRTFGPNRGDSSSPGHGLCETGTLQSPISIADAAHTRFKELRFDYAPTPMRVRNDGHAIQVDYAPGSFLSSGNKRYELIQFHFHSPSEHIIDGRRFPMEVHLVHRAKDGTLAVVGVFVSNGRHHGPLHRMNLHVPKEAGQSVSIANAVIDARDFLPRGKDHVRYVGSLTTPPCTEGVQWHVMIDPIEASQHQFDAFLAVVPENARPVQPVLDRIVLRSGSSTGPILQRDALPTSSD